MLIHIMAASYAALTLAIFLGALGAPLPLGVALAAAGALARQGHLHLSILFLCSVGAAVIGDNLGYLAGRYPLAHLRHGIQRRSHARRRWRLVEWCERHGNLGLLIFLTRWSLTAPATAVNLLAGYRRFPWRTFAAIDLAGEILWVSLALAPGYLLGGALGWRLGLIAVGVLALTLLLSVLGRGALTRYASVSPARRPILTSVGGEPTV